MKLKTGGTLETVVENISGEDVVLWRYEKALYFSIFKVVDRHLAKHGLTYLGSPYSKYYGVYNDRGEKLRQVNFDVIAQTSPDVALPLAANMLDFAVRGQQCLPCHRRSKVGGHTMILKTGEEIYPDVRNIMGEDIEVWCYERATYFRFFSVVDRHLKKHGLSYRRLPYSGHYRVYNQRDEKLREVDFDLVAGLTPMTGLIQAVNMLDYAVAGVPLKGEVCPDPPLT
jgi:hypothetical protein